MECVNVLIRKSYKSKKAILPKVPFLLFLVLKHTCHRKRIFRDFLPNSFFTLPHFLLSKNTSGVVTKSWQKKNSANERADGSHTSFKQEN